ncbi:MAG: hypothetical protein AB1508_15165 [Pseudomonadota bacterium]
MTKLSYVVAFAPRPKLTNRRFASGLPAQYRRGGRALACQWRADPSTGQLFCSWSRDIAGGNFDVEPQLRLAS